MDFKELADNVFKMGSVLGLKDAIKITLSYQIELMQSSKDISREVKVIKSLISKFEAQSNEWEGELQAINKKSR